MSGSEVGVGGHVGEGVADQISRLRDVALGEAHPKLRGEHELGGVTEHAAEARLPLAVGEQAGVQQRERLTGPDLPVGDSRAIGVVIEAQPSWKGLAAWHTSHRTKPWIAPRQGFLRTRLANYFIVLTISPV